jgi:hypothetical protein
MCDERLNVTCLFLEKCSHFEGLPPLRGRRTCELLVQHQWNLELLPISVLRRCWHQIFERLQIARSRGRRLCLRQAAYGGIQAAARFAESQEQLSPTFQNLGLDPLTCNLSKFSGVTHKQLQLTWIDAHPSSMYSTTPLLPAVNVT